MSSNNGDQRSLQVLHVASFSGNIGDNANHMGFRPWFEDQVGRPVEWTSLEIREFYWKERQWDDDFVFLANSFDLLIIGGGNYFELWVEDSPTGTSVAIEPKTFAKIGVPVLFNALGVDPGQGVPGVSLRRFRAFLDTLLSSDQYLVSVRNDGAQANLEYYLTPRHAEQVLRVPDAGFFCPHPAPAEKPKDQLRVAINLASDMPEVRFAGFTHAGGIDGFSKETATTLETISERFPNVDFVFVPHIFRDLEIISNVIDHLGDRMRRTRVAVAAYGSGDKAAEIGLSIYRGSDVVLGTRFHANVCPIGMGIQTFGMAAYPQINNLYAELGQPERAIMVSEPGFGEKLLFPVSKALSRQQAIEQTPDDAMVLVRDLRSAFGRELQTWLETNRLT